MGGVEEEFKAVERVAKALFDDCKDHSRQFWSSAREATKRKWRKRARAAIAAISPRTITPVMWGVLVEAGANAIEDSWFWNGTVMCTPADKLAEIALLAALPRLGVKVEGV
jgi:hypothetical protein